LADHNPWLEITEEVQEIDSAAVPRAPNNGLIGKEVISVDPFIDHSYPAGTEPHSRYWYQHLADEPLDQRFMSIVTKSQSSFALVHHCLYVLLRSNRSSEDGFSKQRHL
jgi:hypothetical protein